MSISFRNLTIVSAPSAFVWVFSAALVAGAPPLEIQMRTDGAGPRGTNLAWPGGRSDPLRDGFLVQSNERLPGEDHERPLVRIEKTGLTAKSLTPNTIRLADGILAGNRTGDGGGAQLQDLLLTQVNFINSACPENDLCPQTSSPRAMC